MNKKQAFLLSLLITLIIAGNWVFFNAESLFAEREKVLLVRVLDGDTVELEDGRKIRLLNINTPEKNEFGADLAFNYLLEFENETVELESAGIEKYGRVLGRLYDGRSYINLQLVELGFAHPFLVREEEQKEFDLAQDQAIEEKLGIWENSEYYGCIDGEINKKDEYVIVSNKCGINFKGWIIKDESTKKYTFDNFQSDYFTLYSGEGLDTNDELYWNAGNVWNNDKDSLFIRDDEGLLVYHSSYGY